MDVTFEANERSTRPAHVWAASLVLISPLCVCVLASCSPSTRAPSQVTTGAGQTEATSAPAAATDRPGADDAGAPGDTTAPAGAPGSGPGGAAEPGAPRETASTTICGREVQLSSKTFSAYCEGEIGETNLSELSKLSQLENLLLRNLGVGEQELDAIASAGSVRELTLHACGVRAGLAPLSKLSKLERLSFFDTPLEDEELAPLSKLQTVRFLDLQMSSGLTAKGLAHIGELENLEQVRLTLDRVGPRELEELFKMPRLQSVLSQVDEYEPSPHLCEGMPRCFDFRSSKLTRKGLQALSKMRLTALFLNKDQVTDRSLELISTIKGLSRLSCEGMFDVESTKQIEHCASFPGNREWRGTEVTPVGLRSLKRLPIKRMFWDAKQVDGSVLRGVVQLPQLLTFNCRRDRDECGDSAYGIPVDVVDHCVDLTNTAVTGADLAALKRLPEPMQVYLPEGVELGPVSVSVLASRFRMVNSDVEKTFDLRTAVVDARALRGLRGSKNVRSLKLFEVEIDADVVRTLKTLPELRSLELAKCKIAQKEALQLVRFPRLVELLLPPEVTDEYVLDAAAQQGNLWGFGIDRARCEELCRSGDAEAVEHGNGSSANQRLRRHNQPSGEGSCPRLCRHEADVFFLNLDGLAAGSKALASPVFLSTLAARPGRVRILFQALDDRLLHNLAQHLPRLDALNCGQPRCVGITSGEVSTVGYGALVDLTEIEVLKVNRHAISDELVKVMEKMPRLKAVNPGVPDEEIFDLAGSQPLSPERIIALGRAHKIRAIALSPGEIDDRLLWAVSKIPGIESLSCRICAGSLDHQATCVNLFGTGVTRNGLAHLERMNKARRFFIPPELLDDLTLAVISRNLETLNCVDMDGDCGELSDVIYAKGRCVNLAGTKVSLEGLEHLRHLGKGELRLDKRIPAEKARALLPGWAVLSDREGPYFDRQCGP